MSFEVNLIKIFSYMTKKSWEKLEDLGKEKRFQDEIKSKNFLWSLKGFQ